MAIYYLKIKKSSRGGKYIPPVAHLEYINREGKYKNREDILEKKTKNLPEEFKNIEDFWKSCEAYERINANLYREFEISLPKEFTSKENKKLVNDFCEHILGKDYIYNYAIHNPKSFDGEYQPHVHIMFFERKIDGIKREKEGYFKRYNKKNPEKGGWQKNVEWTKKETLKNIRKEWEIILNFELEKRGLEKVSSKSLKDQKRDAQNNNDYEKAYLLDRQPINIKGELLYKKESQLSDIEKAEKRLFKKNRILKDGTTLMKKLLEKIKDIQKEYKVLKEKNIKEIENLEEIRKIEKSIKEKKEKMSDERIKNTVYNLMTNRQFYNLLNENKKIARELKKESDESKIKYLKIKKSKNSEKIEELKNNIHNDRRKNFIFKKRTENIKNKYLKKVKELEIKKEEIYNRLKNNRKEYNDLKNGIYNINHLQYIHENFGEKEIKKIETECQKRLEELNRKTSVIKEETILKDKYSGYKYSELEVKISEIEKRIIELKKEIENADEFDKEYYEEWLKKEERRKEEFLAKRENIEVKVEKKIKKDLSESNIPLVKERERIKEIIKNIEGLKIINKTKKDKKRGETEKVHRSNKRSFHSSQQIGGDFKLRDMEILEELER